MKSNQNNKKISLILAAAGLGTRFSSEIPKQYFKIDNQTILEKTLNIFTNISAIKKIVIPLHKNDKEFKKLDLPDGLNIVTVTGGETRAESVLQALKLVDKEAYVIVHDAVRPFIDQKDIHLLIDEFENQNEDCLVYGLPVYESLKNINFDDQLAENSLSVPLKEAREKFEKEYLTIQLKKFNGNISKTANFVGMERSALHRKLKGLGIKEFN